MPKSTRTIVSLGIVTVVFMAVMSVVYLGHVPSPADLTMLEAEIRDEFALVLSPSAPIELSFSEPEREGRRMGLKMVCTLRPTLLKKKVALRHHLDKMAEHILNHARWRGKVDVVKVSHRPPLQMSRTLRAPERP